MRSGSELMLAVMSAGEASEGQGSEGGAAADEQRAGGVMSNNWPTSSHACPFPMTRARA